MLALRAFGLGRALQRPLQVLHLPAQTLALALDLRGARRQGDVCGHPQRAARRLGSTAARSTHRAKHQRIRIGMGTAGL
jgi:hypothetical protein